nr:hypothetical protein [Tanacetum cinerariifolium]
MFMLLVLYSYVSVKYITLQHLPFSPATIPGNPGRLVAGDDFPGRHVAREKSNGKCRMGYLPGRLSWATKPGPHILVKQLSATVEIDRWEYGRRVKKYEGFRVDVKRKSIKDKVYREVFEVDEAFDIENSRARSFQMKGIHIIKTRVNAVRDWSSPKTLPEDLVKAFKLPTEPHHSPYLIRWIKKGPTLKVIEICKIPLANGKHYNELVTCDVVDIEACHCRFSQDEFKEQDFGNFGASPRDIQAERKETRVSYALVMKGVSDAMENAIPSVIKPLLAGFGKTVIDDTLDALPPFRNIQQQIDLTRKTTLLVFVSNEVLGFDSIKELYVNDEDCGNIWMELETKQHRGEFILLDGYLFKCNRLCILKTSLRS